MGKIGAAIKKWGIIAPEIRRKLLSPGVLFNLFLQRLSVALKLGRALGMPSHLTLEPTNLCPLHCVACPTGTGVLKRPRGMLSFENYTKIIDQVSKNLLKIDLYWMGESFLSKDVFRMVWYARSKGIAVQISTIGFVYDENTFAEVVSSGLDTLTVPVDGATEETYTAYRKGGNLAKTIEFIKGVVREKEARNSRYPRIIMQFVVMPKNIHEIDEMKELARSLKVDELYLKPFRIDRAFDAGEDPRFAEFVLDNPDQANYIIKDGRVEWKDKPVNMCKPLWTTTSISWDGNVCPLCCDSDNNYIFGNILKQDFREIWNSKDYVAFRGQVLKDKSKIPLCSFCPGNK